MRSQRSAEYDSYINSELWKLRRMRWINRAGNHCCFCLGWFPSRSLQAHHVTYERLGNERDADIQVCCRTCHPKADEFRRLMGSIQRQTPKNGEPTAYWDAVSNVVFDQLGALYGMTP